LAVLYTDYSDDEVIWAGFSFGGLSELYDPKDKKLRDLNNARWAENLATQFGIFGREVR